MVASLLCAMVLAQASHSGVKLSPPKPRPQEEWPVFEGHEPVAMVQYAPIRTWVYSFRGNFDELISTGPKALGPRFGKSEFTKLRFGGSESRAFDRGVQFSAGSITISILIYDNSYTFLENCRVRDSKSWEEVFKNMSKEKGWVTVIRNEPNPGMWKSVAENETPRSG